MAGVKGRSGGARPGSGPKPKPHAPEPPPAVVGSDVDPLEFLIGVMRGQIEATALQVRAAIAAAQYKHTKTHDGGKKDETADRAKKAAGGKFASAPPPLKIVGR